MNCTQLESLFPVQRYSGNPIIKCQSNDWKDSQIYDPVVLQDPADPDGLIMYASGMTAPTKYGVQSIGRFTARKSAPYDWTVTHGPVFSLAAESDWESGAPEGGVRLGSVVYDATCGMYFLYYTGGEPMSFKIGLATSSDGIHWMRDPHAGGLVVSPAGDEYAVNDPAVIKDGETWYMYFGYRREGSLLEGIRYATSSDGRTWTRQAGNLLSLGKPGSYDCKHIEWHQVFKLGSEYVLLYECFDGSSYSIAIAHSTSPSGEFFKSPANPVLAKTGVPGTFDQFHVATACLVEIDGRWIVYYSGAFDATPEYGTSHWHLGAGALG